MHEFLILEFLNKKVVFCDSKFFKKKIQLCKKKKKTSIGKNHFLKIRLSIPDLVYKFSFVITVSIVLIKKETRAKSELFGL